MKGVLNTFVSMFWDGNKPGSPKRVAKALDNAMLTKLTREILLLQASNMRETQIRTTVERMMTLHPKADENELLNFVLDELTNSNNTTPKPTHLLPPHSTSYNHRNNRQYHALHATYDEDDDDDDEFDEEENENDEENDNNRSLENDDDDNDGNDDLEEYYSITTPNKHKTTFKPPRKKVKSADKDDLTPLDLEQVEDEIATLRTIFPDCQEEYLRTRLLALTSNQTASRVQILSDEMFEKKDYPKLIRSTPQTIPKGKEFYNTSSFNASAAYTAGALIKICNLFPRVAMKKIREVMEENKQHFLPSVRQLERSKNVDTLKSSRKPLPDFDDDADPILLTEVEFMNEENRKEEEKRDKELAKKLHREECIRNGDVIECGCCFDEVPFDDMVNCKEGHLHCITCYQNAANALLDMGRSELRCLERGCEYVFDVSEMERFLDEQKFDFYQKQLVSDQLRQAFEGVDDDLISCPFCDFAVVMENKDDKVLNCLSCQRSSCRLCRQPAHLPLRCDEVEDHRETNMRVFVEEKMTEALIRTCPKCHKKFFKEEGCNHMKCPCGQEMCYICREPIKGYDHFHKAGSKCKLHVDTVQVNNQDVKKALVTAQERFLEENETEVPKDSIKIEQAFEKLEALVTPKPPKPKTPKRKRR